MSVESESVTVPARHRTGVSVASLVCGIIAMICSVFWVLSLPLGIIAIVLGALGWIATSREPQREGRYQAIGGLITGAIGVLVGIISIAFILTPGKLNDRCVEYSGGVTACYER
jgi:hypothetical protein